MVNIPNRVSVRGNFLTRREILNGGGGIEEGKNRSEQFVDRGVYFKVRYLWSHRERRNRRRGSSFFLDGLSFSRKSNFAAREVI